MTTFIEAPELSYVDRDMSPNTSILFTVLLGASMAGMFIYELYKKQKDTDNSLKELENEIGDIEAVQQTHSDLLEEQDQRIREKKNYEESEEVQEGKYQGWEGVEKTNTLCSIQIWREKTSTYKKNQEWLAWEDCEDASTIVRDFYLGNSNPDFTWTFMDSPEFISGYVSETMVNGWDSVIQCKIIITFKSEKELLEYIGSDIFETNSCFNAALKKMIVSNSISWTRSLKDI